MFLTLWPYDKATFGALNASQQTALLHEWHAAVIREKWATLSAEEKGWIEQWRERTYRHYNPIDQGPEMKKPEFIQEAKQLDYYAKNI